MLRIEYFDKDRFMRQVSASHGSVLLHLDNGKTCDLKKDATASSILRMMNAPKKGFDITVTDPTDVTGFLRYMLEAGRRSGRSARFRPYRMQRLMARATARSSSCPIKPNFASCSSAKQTVSSEVCSGSPKPAVWMPKCSTFL